MIPVELLSSLLQTLLGMQKETAYGISIVVCLIIAFKIIYSKIKKNHKKKSYYNANLERIHYVKVKYSNPKNGESYDQFYAVEPCASIDCYMFFIDSAIFSNNTFIKEDIIFLDENKNEIPTNIYQIKIEEKPETSCGFILICPIV